MFEAVVSFFRSLFAEQQQEKLLIRVPVEQKRPPFHRR